MIELNLSLVVETVGAVQQRGGDMVDMSVERGWSPDPGIPLVISINRIPNK